jgi:hypothetical protein
MTDWIAWDVIGDALTKTRQMLFEPFDLRKWLKLAIILFFIGSGGGGGSSFSPCPPGNTFGGFDGFSQPGAEPDVCISEALSGISDSLYPRLWYIVLAALFILMVSVFFSYISNVMQFALVESVVRNRITLKSYIRNNLGNGLQLFILNWALGIIFLIAIVLSLLPALSAIPEHGISALFNGSLFTFFLVAVSGVTILVMLSSFINLAIPVMLYERIGIIKALSKVIGLAMHSIPQVLVYWVMRIILGIVAAIIAAVVGIIVALLAALVLLLVGIAVYLILTLLGFGFPNLVVLIVLGLLFFASTLILVFLVTLATAPLPVFLKYHALLFLQNWYGDIVPFRDMELESESG